MRARAVLLSIGLASPAWAATPAMPIAGAEPAQGGAAAATVEPADGPADEPAVEPAVDGEAPSKKQQALLAKRSRQDVRALSVPAPSAHTALTLRNLWTREVLAVDLASLARPVTTPDLDGFLRDHFTNQATRMDPRLGDMLLRAASRFGSSLVEVVSGYRSDKYNLMLRKKGHAVARDSQHPLGNAVDFRLAGVGTKALYKFVRSLRLGGAGLYLHGGFVHADVGRVRTWNGE
jgi:uncharacterized protein YcbK (DUF882 family)